MTAKRVTMHTFEYIPRQEIMLPDGAVVQGVKLADYGPVIVAISDVGVDEAPREFLIFKTGREIPGDLACDLRYLDLLSFEGGHYHLFERIPAGAARIIMNGVPQ